MKLFALLGLLAALGAALLAALVPDALGAQAEPTPILGEPVVVTPLATSETELAPPSGPVGEPTAGVSSRLPSPASVTATADRCEPNDVPARACALPLDAVSGPFTIVPESDQDFFQLDLPQEPSIQTTITVRATDGLDLALSARQENRLIASGAYSLTLSPDVAGPVVLRVENRDPRPAAGEQYRVEVRRQIVPPIQAEGGTAEATAPDSLENNWSFDTAAAIAVGVVYDLTFACPDPRPDACPGGDHDYLLVPVKAGISYLIATFDLDPGVDTVVELFWGATTAAAAGNDDYAPGGALSALRWVAPSDGLLAMRVAPRNGGHAQNLAEGKNGYRFAVAPEASELARKLEATIRQQANVPTPTPTVAAAPSSAEAPATGGGDSFGGGGSSPAGGAAAQENIAAGPALIVTETLLRREPRENGEALATLPPESRVAVRGPVSGSWVSVESDRSILPGWVRAADLERISASTATAAPAVEGGTPATSSQQPGAVATPHALPTISATSGAGGAQPPARHVVVNVLDPALPPAPPSTVERVPFTLLVVVAATDRPPVRSAMIGIATPTPDLQQPVAGVRVQLVNVFGDLLAEGLTDAQGETQLRRDVRPGDALVVRVPAWGVELPLAADQTHLIFTLPEAHQ